MERKKEFKIVLAGAVIFTAAQLLITPVIDNLSDPLPKGKEASAGISTDNPFLQSKPDIVTNKRPPTDSEKRQMILWEELHSR